MNAECAKSSMELHVARIWASLSFQSCVLPSRIYVINLIVSSCFSHSMKPNASQTTLWMDLLILQTYSSGWGKEPCVALGWLFLDPAKLSGKRGLPGYYVCDIFQSPLPSPSVHDPGTIIASLNSSACSQARQQGIMGDCRRTGADRFLIST